MEKYDDGMEWDNRPLPEDAPTLTSHALGLTEDPSDPLYQTFRKLLKQGDWINLGHTDLEEFTQRFAEMLLKTTTEEDSR